MNFHESADRDFSIQFCEYNYSNPDYDQIYRPNGSGDYLFLLFKTPMKSLAEKIRDSLDCGHFEQFRKKYSSLLSERI